MRKAKSERKHAIRRAAERYGIDLAQHDYEQLCGQIRKAKDATFVGRQSTRVSVWQVTHCSSNTQMMAVYDKQRGEISTFLPADVTSSTVWTRYDEEEK